MRPAGPQLGQVAQRGPGVTGPDVRKRLGDGVDLGRRQTQRSTDVAHRVAHPVGVDHRHRRHPFAAEHFEHLGVDLGSTGGFDVEIDVGQRPAQRREEPLHHQPVGEWVDTGYTEQVVDETARPRPPGGTADTHVAYDLDHVGDREEIGREPERGDGVEFGVESPGDVVGEAAVAFGDPGVAPLPQHRHRLLAGGAEHVELGQMNLSETDVGVRIEPATDRGGAGVGDQPLGTVDAAAGVTGDLTGHLEHVFAGFEVSLGVAAIDVAHVEGDEPARRVEDVDGGGQMPVRHAHMVGEDAGEMVSVGQGEHRPRLVGGAHSRARQVMVGDRDHHLRGIDHVEPAAQFGLGVVETSAGHRHPELGIGSEHDHQVAAHRRAARQDRGW